MPTPFERRDPAAEATLMHLIGGAIRTQALYVVAKLGVADHLSLGPRTATDLAERTAAHASTLARILRFLVSSGVFVEEADGRFALNGVAELLQTAHPRSMRPGAIRAGEGVWQVSSRLLAAAQTGRTPYEEVHGTTFFDRTDAREFGARMNGSAAGLGDAIAHLESIADADRLVDVGGGSGAVLRQILEVRPHLHGVLFDRAEAIDVARSPGGARFELVAGDFFDALPPGDVYLLSWILHDWDDDRALKILRACRGDVVVVEALLPERAMVTEAVPGVLAGPFALDMQMLLLTGGRERTLAEYGELLRRAGFEVERVSAIDSARGASAIEARRLAQEKIS